MKYTVISEFIDKQDNELRYKKGDAFPREGKEVNEERLEFLSSIPFIKLNKAENQGNAEDPYKDLEPSDLKAMLDEKGIEYTKNAARKKLIELLENAESTGSEE